MTRRNIELILLCVAALLVLLLFGMLVVNQGLELNIETLAVPVGLFAAFIIAHIVVRKLAPGADPALLPIVFALSGVGISFVTRVAPYSEASNMATNQVIWLFLGVVCMIAVLLLFRNIDKIANFKYTLMLIGFALMLSPLIPGLGVSIYGSQIWISVFGFSFQPGEIAKVIIVLFLAGYLAQNREMLSVFTWRIGPFRLPDIRTLLPMLLMWGVSLLIVMFERDLGSALVFFFVFLVMLYVATGKKFYLVTGAILIAVGAVLAWSLFDHVQTRVEIWLDPFADATGSGYQIVQATYGLADGGLFGVGIGRGMLGGLDDVTQLPVVESDFIFACIAEETGLLGAAGLLLLFLCFAIRGILTAARAKSDVSSFMAVGLTSIIVLQAFIIVGGVTRLIPLTGITLPFVSQGGSSLVAGFIIVGFLLRCGNDGTGVGTEMKATRAAAVSSDSVLGRVALGKRLTTTMVIFALMFAVLVANLTVTMVVRADEIQSMPGNGHTLYKESQVERGTISTYDGVILAQSVKNESGTYDRVYPAGDLASQVVGYYSATYGSSGIEEAYNDTLQGDQNYATFTDVVNAMAGIKTAGNDVKLTINSTIQQAAQDALGDSAGAVVVLDPETGAILAMASSPTYDAADFELVLSGDSDDGALINRAIQALYAPGSTFKTVTLAAALSEDIADEDSVYSAPSSITIGNADITNANGRSYGSLTLEQATWYSVNTVFSQVGVELGAELLVQYAEAFGFNDSMAFDLPLVSSLMPDPDEMTEWETAWAADGQPVGEHESPAGPQATVLQMAMVASAFANDGVIMQPYLVDSIYNADGEKSYQATSSVYKRAVSAEIAERVTEVLTGVVNSGTGSTAAISGVQVAGKTGTAETGNELSDSWFIGYAPADDPKVVIAIVVEQNDEESAARRARNILETALSVEGLL